MRLKYTILTLAIGLCAPSVSQANNDLSQFNFSSIEADKKNIKSMVFHWTSAATDSAVQYDLCEKNSASQDSCDVLDTLFLPANSGEHLQASVSVDSVIDAITKDYFILARIDDKKLASNEQSISHDVATEMIGFFKSSDASMINHFGYEVVLSDDGNTMIVSAPLQGTYVGCNSVHEKCQGVYQAGQAYVFEKNNGSWKETQILARRNPSEMDFMFHSMALSGDGNWLAAASNKKYASQDDLVFFKRQGGKFVQTHTVKLYDQRVKSLSKKPMSMSKDGGALILGHPEFLEKQGLVEVFRRSSDERYDALDKIRTPNYEQDSSFGTSVAISSDGLHVLVGAPGYKGGDVNPTTGAAFVYTRKTTNSVWQKPVRLPTEHLENVNFGQSVDINKDGSLMVVSAPGNSSDKTLSGEISIFRRGEAGDFTVKTLKLLDGEAGFQLGLHLDLSTNEQHLAASIAPEGSFGTGIYVGLKGQTENKGYYPSVYLFEFDAEDDEFKQRGYVKATNYDSNTSMFGASVKYNGKTLAVGAPYDTCAFQGIVLDNSEVNQHCGDYEGMAQGAVFVY